MRKERHRRSQNKMDSNEEYLDQLLKSLTEGNSSGTAGDADSLDQDDGLEDLLNQFSDDTDHVPEDLFSGLLGDSDNSSAEPVDLVQGSAPTDESVLLSDILQNVTAAPDSQEQDVTAASDSQEQDLTAAPDSREQDLTAAPDSREQDLTAAPDFQEQDLMAGDGTQEPDLVAEDSLWDQEMAVENDSQEPGMTAGDVLRESEKTEDFSEVIQSAEDRDMQAFSSEETEQPVFEIPATDDFSADEVFASEPEPTSADDLDDDLGSLLESLGAGGDQDAQEISELLDKADNDEPISNMVDSLMQGLNEEVFPEVGYSGDDFLGEDAIDALLGSQETEENTDKKKKEKKKKEKKPRRGKKKKELEELAADLDNEDSSQDIGDITLDEPSEGEKKQGFWGKLLNALTQEEEEEEDPSDLVSDENGEILKQLDKEKKQSKGKKKKKGKDKKAAEAEEDEDFDDVAEAKQKKKKEKKPKKEKQPAPVEEPIPGKKLSLKKVLPLVAVFLVLCLAFVMISHLYINHVNKQEAENAYYAEDYLECYSLFYGQDLNESQEVMFHRSELVLQMERMKGNYRRLVMEGKELEALDYLVQCICRREDCYLRGQEWNSLDVVEEAYGGMMGLLTANYGLTEEQAKEIAALKKDKDYTIALLQVLNGFASADEEEQPVSYEDLLPEEEEDTASSFIDTLG